MLTLVVIILFLIAVSIIALVVVRKLPQLASLHIEESSREKLKQLKKSLIVSRMIRKLEAVKKKVIAPETWQRVQYIVRQSYTRLKMLEEKYRANTADAKIKILLKRGLANIVDDPELAEQCFLDVITLDPRNLDAYEGLSQIYLERKNMHEAQEIAEFLIKINPAARVRYFFELAQKFLQIGDGAEAWKYALQSVNIEPANPKYLDFIIELAILQGSTQDGREYLERLRGVNPENAKLTDFEERLQVLAKEARKAKVHK